MPGLGRPTIEEASSKKIWRFSVIKYLQASLDIKMWCEVSLIAPSHRTCKIWARIDLVRSRLKATRHTILQDYRKVGQNWLSFVFIHLTIQASIELKLEGLWDHMCLDNGSIPSAKSRPISVLYIACILFAISLTLWNEQSRARKFIPKQSKP